MADETAPPGEAPEAPDPRAEAVRDELAALVRSGLGAWRGAVESQTKLAHSLEQMQQEMDEILELSALPVFRGGMPLLEAGVNRVQLCKKRVIAIGNRLKKLDTALQAKKQQKQRQLDAQKAAAARAPARRPPPREGAPAAPGAAPPSGGPVELEDLADQEPAPPAPE
jgi:hypothetical protein